MRQPHRWSQEDLAYAMGTEQPQISRIESNRQRPMYSTLIRISNAFDLTPKDRARLLHLAGYETGPALPDRESVDRVVSGVAPALDRELHPVALVDDSERMWYCNTVHFRLWGKWQGFSNRANYLASMTGQRWVELIFNPNPAARIFPPWASNDCEDVDELLARQVALHWRAYYRHMDDADLAESVSRLKRDPEFSRRWDELEKGYGDFVYVDHITYSIRHPHLGRLKLATWKTRLALDDRFLVVYASAADSRTSRILDGWLA
ncbi:MAG: helix-turn-helix domain-containing protein [Candidatus Dormibacteraeota bacterium]|nr:helix-turn-helix domain-containing protein [Candidatus Dormibacteraeota bacterium]